jgi:hypothetical protein
LSHKDNYYEKEKHSHLKGKTRLKYGECTFWLKRWRAIFEGTKFKFISLHVFFKSKTWIKSHFGIHHHDDMMLFVLNKVAIIWGFLPFPRPSLSDKLFPKRYPQMGPQKLLSVGCHRSKVVRPKNGNVMQCHYGHMEKFCDGNHGRCQCIMIDGWNMMWLVFFFSWFSVSSLTNVKSCPAQWDLHKVTQQETIAFYVIDALSLMDCMAK